ncbi:uncharacterized protein LOC112054642 [Bicyclus anynana]|uniref:Uncharacterized protein LOC112054642 n=1 Tax=Bicyclus anynana TaxID=110368 RepID=A0A6J1NYE4_BICAN|nr:uncharacterized protein LOC112054642 [Bicyclus anynana]
MGLRSMPINSRFNVKFSPVLEKEDISLGALFAKIPQDWKPGSAQKVLSKYVLPDGANLEIGSTNQIAKIILPPQSSTEEPKVKENTSYINIPIIMQPFDAYNVIVATAPKNMRLGKGENAKPVVVYVVFPDDDGDPMTPKIPSIYFITKPDEPLPFQKKKEDPVLLVDSNRTVTGLKSKAMIKFVKFHNKMTNQLEIH